MKGSPFKPSLPHLFFFQCFLQDPKNYLVSIFLGVLIDHELNPPCIWKGSEFASKTTVRTARRTLVFVFSPRCQMGFSDAKNQRCSEDDVFFGCPFGKVPSRRSNSFFTNFLLVFEAKHLWENMSCLLYNI